MQPCEVAAQQQRRHKVILGSPSNSEAEEGPIPEPPPRRARSRNRRQGGHDPGPCRRGGHDPGPRRRGGHDPGPRRKGGHDSGPRRPGGHDPVTATNLLIYQQATGNRSGWKNHDTRGSGLTDTDVEVLRKRFSILRKPSQPA